MFHLTETSTTKQMTPINGAITKEGLLQQSNRQSVKWISFVRQQVRILLETVGNSLQYFLVDKISAVAKSPSSAALRGNGAQGGETNS